MDLGIGGKEVPPVPIKFLSSVFVLWKMVQVCMCACIYIVYVCINSILK